MRRLRQRQRVAAHTGSSAMLSTANLLETVALGAFCSLGSPGGPAPALSCAALAAKLWRLRPAHLSSCSALPACAPDRPCGGRRRPSGTRPRP